MTHTHEPVIAGIGESDFRRRACVPFASLQVDAIEAALVEAGLVGDDVEGIYTDSQVMPGLCPIDTIEAALRLRNVESVGSFSTAGTGIGYAVMAAAEAVRDGRCKAVVVYFGVNWGSAAGGPYAFHDRWPSKQHFERPYGFYGQPVYFAAMARRYGYKYGVAEDELVDAFAAIAIGQRRNAQRNANAQMRKPLTRADYDAGRMIAEPLRLNDCCLLSDGAAALVITSRVVAEAASDHPPVSILGGGYGHQEVTDEAFFSQNPGYPALPAAYASARQARAAAGVSADELDFVELYDCFTISVLLQLEALGVCGPGEARHVVAAGVAVGDAPLPINTHGGFLSQAYLLGINHITEAVKQLRGTAGEAQVDGARLGAVALPPSRDHVTLIFGV